MNTFVLAAVALVAITVCTAEDRPRDMNNDLIEECQKSTKATESDVKAYMTRQPQTTKAGWCLLGCIKKKMGTINAKNQWDLDKMKENMAGMKASNKEMYEKVVALMTECKKEADTDPKNSADECAIAEAVVKCFFNKKAAAEKKTKK